MTLPEGREIGSWPIPASASKPAPEVQTVSQRQLFQESTKTPFFLCPSLCFVR